MTTSSDGPTPRCRADMSWLWAAGSWFVLSRARTGSQGLSLFPVFAAIAFHTRTLVTVGPIDLSDVVVFGFAGAWVLQRLMHPERRIASGPQKWVEWAFCVPQVGQK